MENCEWNYVAYNVWSVLYEQLWFADKEYIGVVL